VNQRLLHEALTAVANFLGGVRITLGARLDDAIEARRNASDS
jgi:hypothetical protein